MSTLWAALIPLIILEVALIGYCLFDIARHPRTRLLPRAAWIAICLLVATLGPIAYLLVGRDQNR